MLVTLVHHHQIVNPVLMAIIYQIHLVWFVWIIVKDAILQLNVYNAKLAIFSLILNAYQINASLANTLIQKQENVNHALKDVFLVFQRFSVLNVIRNIIWEVIISVQHVWKIV